MRAAHIKDGKVVNIIIVDDLSFPVDGYLVDAGSANIGYLWDGLSFTKPSIDLSSFKVKKRAEIEKSYIEKMQSGFISSALGTPHNYDSDGFAMTLLVGAVATGINIPYPCHTPDGVEVIESHTPAQMQQVLRDGAAVAISLKATKNLLFSRIENSTDVASIETIKWP